MKGILKQPVFPVFLIQSILILIGFSVVFSNTNGFMFVNIFDCLKNYFTLHAYIGQDASEGFWKLNQMNYPYGEYIFYVDNTPIFALFVKGFSHYIYDISAYSFALFHLLVTGSMFLTTFFCYKILKVFIKTPFLVIVCSIGLPWIHPQITRIFGPGHLNLSFAWIILCVLYLLIKLYQHHQTHQKLPIKWASILGISLVFFAFIHLYYLLISAVIIAGFFFFWGLLSHRKSLWTFVRLTTSGVGIALFGVLFSGFIIWGIDEYYALRATELGSYDYAFWKLYFPSLFSHYPWNSVKFPLVSLNYNYESYAYLGNFSLYGLLFLGVWGLWKKKGRMWLKENTFAGTNTRLLQIIGLMSLMSLMISLGNVIKFDDSDYQLYNILNPFFYLDHFIPQITHFRCLGRFSWIFFWVFNLIVLVLIDRFVQSKSDDFQTIFARFSNQTGSLKEKGKVWWNFLQEENMFPWYIVILCTIFLASDTRDHILKIKAAKTENVLQNEQKMDYMNQLAKQIEIDAYQAFLPLPYFHVGSEDYEYTLDNGGWWFTQCLQFNLLTDLPMMSNVSARTAPSQAKALFSLFESEKPEASLLAKLNDKPILVIRKKSALLEREQNHLPKNAHAKEVFYLTKTFPEDKSLRKILEWNDMEVFEYFPKK